MDVQKREKEVSDGFKKYSDDAKRYQEIEQLLTPVRPIYQQNGLKSDAEAIKYLLQWEASIRQNPALAIRHLVQQFGIDPASFAQQNPGQSTGPDPLQQYLQPISQQLGSVQGELERMKSERAAAEITEFAKDKPHFERVKTEMGQLLQAGLAQNLDDAYQKATWSNPEIKAELMAKELEGQLASKQQESQQRAQQARKAAVSPGVRAPAAPQLNGKEKPKGIRGSILAAVEEIRESSRA
jgi:hypothetical protein